MEAATGRKIEFGLFEGAKDDRALGLEQGLALAPGKAGDETTVAGAVVLLARKNRSNTRPCWAGGTPGPVLVTTSSAAGPSRRSAMITRPPDNTSRLATDLAVMNGLR
jgi:hypothetical protein